MTLTGYALALLLPPALLVGWVLVQRAWGRRFAAPGDDEDALARRGGCGSCGCLTPCERAIERQPRDGDRA